MGGIEIVFMGILGLCVGSFLNVLIYRTPREISIISPRSRCPQCQTPIRWWHNIPLVSYLMLRGKCADCGSSIGMIYPTVELLSGLLFVVIALKVGFTPQAVIIATVFSLFLALSVIDIHYRAVPDSINLSALALAIIHEPVFQHFHDALVMAGGFTLLRFYVSYALKKEAMGEGDIILAGALGGLLGVKLAMVAIFLSSLLALPIALMVRKQTAQTPFIPFLALAAIIAYLFDERLLRWFGIA